MTHATTPAALSPDREQARSALHEEFKTAIRSARQEGAMSAGDLADEALEIHERATERLHAELDRVRAELSGCCTECDACIDIMRHLADEARPDDEDAVNCTACGRSLTTSCRRPATSPWTWPGPPWPSISGCAARGCHSSPPTKPPHPPPPDRPLPAAEGRHPVALHLVPVRSRDARAFCAMWHRHHAPPAGQIFAVGVADHTGTLRGVAIAGRPVARHFDDGQTLEVTRTVTDGTRNACSLLYGAAWRAAKALGYTRLITYTQAGETGASLRAAGWRVIAQRPAKPGWDRPSRPREPTGTEYMPRTLWEAS